MYRSQREQLRRQLATRALDQCSFDVGIKRRRGVRTRAAQPPELLLDPRPLLLDELNGFALGAPAGNRHPDGSRLLDTQNISFRAGMADEHQLEYGA